MSLGSSDRATLNHLVCELVQMGCLGQKSGAGFRKYDRKGLQEVPDPSLEPVLPGHRLVGEPLTQEAITDRLFLPMLLEAIRAVDEGIARDPADVDVGVTLGLGFPASRGGLFGWCDTESAGSIRDRLGRYQPLGPWFQPSPMLARMAATGGTFLGRLVNRIVISEGGDSFS